MPQVSRNKPHPDIGRRMFELLYKALAEAKKEKEVRDLLQDLITPTERVMLAKRLAIAVLLAKGYDYRQTSFILKVSYGTIGRVVASIRLSGVGFTRFIRNLAKYEGFLSLMEDVDRFLVKAAFPNRRLPEKKQPVL
ncbi:MAG: Trp family transcriptional regulator [Patescibacteria group bacterium]